MPVVTISNQVAGPSPAELNVLRVVRMSLGSVSVLIVDRFHNILAILDIVGSVLQGHSNGLGLTSSDRDILSISRVTSQNVVGIQEVAQVGLGVVVGVRTSFTTELLTADNAVVVVLINEVKGNLT